MSSTDFGWGQSRSSGRARDVSYDDRNDDFRPSRFRKGRNRDRTVVAPSKPLVTKGGRDRNERRGRERSGYTGHDDRGEGSGGGRRNGRKAGVPRGRGAQGDGEDRESRGKGRRGGRDRRGGRGSRGSRGGGREKRQNFSVEELDAQMDNYFNRDGPEGDSTAGGDKKGRGRKRGNKPEANPEKMDSAMESYWNKGKEGTTENGVGNGIKGAVSAETNGNAEEVVAPAADAAVGETVDNAAADATAPMEEAAPEAGTA